MTLVKIAKGTLKAGAALVRLPARAIGQNLKALRAARDSHRENMAYIRELFGNARTRARGTAASRYADQAQGFREAVDNRGAGAQPVSNLVRHFVHQKRWALAAAALFTLLSAIAVVNGHWLGVATLLSALPLFFMASLSAQLRLWQLRTERLSPSEKGGLQDFIREIDGWYWEVLNPEIGTISGEQK